MNLYPTLLGAIAMACLVSGLLFLRFWKSTGDRFFLFFAISFGMEAINRVLLSLMNTSPENLPIFYMIRVLAYGLILFAFIDKNWLNTKNKAA